MARKKTTTAAGEGAGGGGEFEDFDVGAGEPSEFEDFDVTQEEAEGERLLEALGDFEAGEQDFRALLQAQEELASQLLPEPGLRALAAAEEGPAGADNVVGVGIGEKEVGGQPTGQLAVKVLVKEKLNAADVAGEALVPEALSGVPTDVEAVGEIFANRFTARYRPAPGGVSIGNCNMVMAGTLGCLVSRGGQLFILSNNHVMALVNRGPVNVGIPQPGRLDGGVCPNDIIARLTQWVPIVFGGAHNLVDMAIARTSPLLVDRRILRPLGVRQRLVAPDMIPALNMRVQKSGRTTQYRRGYIDLINTTVDVSYAPLGGVARFVRQFRVRGVGGIFSDRGDSGSLVTTYPGNQPVGLLFAGNATSNTTFCNPIRTVLGSLGIAIVY
jgi:hypothetical protein